MKYWLLIALCFTSVMLTTAQDTITPQDLADSNGQFVEVNGTSIYYTVEGNSAHPAVILVHGFGGSTFTWRANQAVIADAGFYVLALDLPPFGLSAKSTALEYSRAALATYIIGLMDVLEIETATLVGHSMGGNIISYLALDYPERIDKLVFVDAALFSRNQPAPDESSANPLSSLLSEIDPDSPFAASLLRVLLSPERFSSILMSAYARQEVITEETIAGYTRPLQLDDWTSGFLAYVQAQNTTNLVLEDLSLTMPILVIWGESDTWIPLSVGESIVTAFPHAELITYAGVGHLPMEENIAQFNTDLIEFLNGN